MSRQIHSDYIKTIGIKSDKLDFIKKYKGKKSASGKLDEIIDFYKYEKKLD